MSSMTSNNAGTFDSSPWWAEIMGGAKPINATAFSGGANGNSNSDPFSNFGSGISGTNSTSTPTGNFNPANSVPTGTSSSAPLANTTGQANSGVGNTQAAVNASMNQQAMNPMMSAPTASGNASAGSTPTGTDGLGSAIGSQLSQTAVGQALKGYLSDAKGAIGGAFSSVGNSINSFGASMFGTGFGGYAGTGDLASETISPALMAADPSLAGTGASATTASAAGDIGAGASTTASLTGIIGGAGIGYGVSNVYNSLAHVQGPNATNSNIGGTLGGAAGWYFGGPIGSVVGSTLGSAIGGMFGPGKGTQAEYAGTSLSSAGALGKIQDEGQKNAGNFAQFGPTVLKQFGQLTSSASQSLGIDFSSVKNVTAGISTEHGGASIQVKGSPQIFFNQQSSKSVTNAYFKALTQAAAHSGYTDTQALHNWFYGTAPTAPSGGGINIAPKSSSNSNLAAPGYNQYGNSSIMV